MSETTYTYVDLDLSTPEKIAERAKQLEGMTFRDVLDLGIAGKGVTSANYGEKSYKGGMGTLLEERFFCYKANSDQSADFAEAGVELKTTCYDVKKKDGELSAGERLVLTMIGYDEPIPDDFFDSHAWEKSKRIMLVYYERNRNIPSYDQRISYTLMFTPPAEDLEIIRADYEKITKIIQEGRAEDLSESLTTYLGACTKGATAEKSMKSQFYPPHTKAKGRAFCFKRQYMDHVLHRYVMGQDTGERIVKDASVLRERTFEELVLEKINAHAGKTDRELCEMLGISYTGNKVQWVEITYGLLDICGDRAEEFEKAGVSVRTLRVDSKGKPREAMSLSPFRFSELVKEDWERAWLRTYFEETRFLFVVFQLEDGCARLRDARFWAMPQRDVEGGLRECWQRTRDAVTDGVELTPRTRRDGKVEYSNNLPKDSDGIVAHVRPHAHRAAYRLPGQPDVGNVERDADQLPDGRWMTRQSFWLNKSYIYEIVRLPKA